MSMTKVLIENKLEEKPCQVSLNWTVAELNDFWKKEIGLDPEAVILSWKHRVVQGVARDVIIPESGTLASHKIKEGSRLSPRYDGAQLQMLELKKRARAYLDSSTPEGPTIKISIMGCNDLNIPSHWRKADLDLFYHTIHETPNQQTSPVSNIHAVRFVAGWRRVRQGSAPLSLTEAPQISEGAPNTSQYCWGCVPGSVPNLTASPRVPSAPRAPQAPQSPSTPRKPIPTREFVGDSSTGILDATKSLAENGIVDGDEYVVVDEFAGIQSLRTPSTNQTHG